VDDLTRGGQGNEDRALLDQSLVESLEAFAEAEIESGDPARAVDPCERLVAFYSAQDGPDAEPTMMWRGFLGRALNEARLHERAEVVLRELVADRTRVLGPEHRSTFVARGNLNRSVGFSGRTGEALDMSLELLADRERVLGPDDPDTLRSRGTVVRLRELRGEQDEALRELEDLHADRARVLGPDHPDTIENYFNLMVSRARTTIELPELDAMIDEVVRLYAAETPAVFIIRSYRPDLLDAAGLPDQAHREAESLYSDRMRTLGELHPATLRSGLALSGRKWQRGEHDIAVQMCRALVRVISATLGECHPLALEARTDLLAMEAADLSADERDARYGELVEDAASVFDEASPDWERVAALFSDYFGDEDDDAEP
jgi:hypothetical protein